jgi:phage baseplate assembly protein W
MKNLDFPLRFDGRGRTATADDEKHIRDLIEQVLFTSPGERLNRPTFGSGLLRLVFEPGGAALAATAQLNVQGALQQWLGELIQVQDVQVISEDASVDVSVRYILRRTQEARVASFVRSRT